MELSVFKKIQEDDYTPLKPVVGIVGLGVMGGSYAARLKELGYTIYGFDKDQQTLDYALNNQMIDQGCLNPEDLLGKCDLVIFCLYPTKIADWIKQTITSLKKMSSLWKSPA